MERHAATFEIESKSDSRAARRLTEKVYDTLREELGESGLDDDAQGETLLEFEEIREAAKPSSPGSLTITYERRDEPFEG